jgi:hypothetical protein
VTQLKSVVDAESHDCIASATKQVTLGNSALYERIRGQIDALPDAHPPSSNNGPGVAADPWQEVLADVIASLRPLTAELSRISGVTVPVVAFELEGSDDLVAELAWPDHNPPVAILSGEQFEYASEWEDVGWKAIESSSLIQAGLGQLMKLLEFVASKAIDIPPGHKPTYESEDTAILDCEVAGLRYALGKLPFHLEDRIELQRESKNVESTFAVRVMHNNHKIGYLPRRHGIAIAKQIDGGEVLFGKIIHIDDSILEVRIAIYSGVNTRVAQ